MKKAFMLIIILFIHTSSRETTSLYTVSVREMPFEEFMQRFCKSHHIDCGWLSSTVKNARNVTVHAVQEPMELIIKKVMEGEPATIGCIIEKEDGLSIVPINHTSVLKYEKEHLSLIVGSL